MKNCLTILFLVSFFGTIAQEISHDTTIIKKSDTTILIVPFRPDLYINEETAEMVAKTELNYDQILNYFRLKLNEEINNRLAVKYYSITLSGSSTASSDEDEVLIFNKIAYFMAETPDLTGEKQNQRIFTNKKDKRKDEENENKSGIVDGQIVSQTISNKNRYLNIKFSDPKLVPSIAGKYHADYVLFINQFEITGDYSNQAKVINGTYDRLVKIHYSVFNNKGEDVFGSFLTVPYPAGLAYPEKIVEIYFPLLADKLFYKMPFYKEEKTTRKHTK